MAVGKRIYLKRNLPDPEIIKQFKEIPASNTADVMGRNCAMNPRIHLVSSPKAQMMVGPAFTVKCRAGDNLALHAALNYCSEGDVLVVSNEEDNTRALMGEIMMAYLYLQKKVAGIVLDGPIRDIDRNHTGRPLQGGTGRGQCSDLMRRRECGAGRYHPGGSGRCDCNSEK